MTGWYTIPETALKAGQQATLEEISKVHRSTYPQIIGGWHLMSHLPSIGKSAVISMCTAL